MFKLVHCEVFRAISTFLRRRCCDVVYFPGSFMTYLLAPGLPGPFGGRFQLSRTRLDTNGWRSPVWPASSLMLTRARGWDEARTPRAVANGLSTWAGFLSSLAAAMMGLFFFLLLLGLLHCFYVSSLFLRVVLKDDFQMMLNYFGSSQWFIIHVPAFFKWVFTRGFGKFYRAKITFAIIFGDKSWKCCVKNMKQT